MGNTKNTDKVKICSLVDENGEIIDELFDGDKIVRKSQTEYNAKYVKNFRNKEAFVKVFTNPIMALYQELTTKEFAISMAIMPFISYSDCILRYDGKIVDIKQMSEILGKSTYESFRSNFSALVDKEVIKKIKVKSDTYQDKQKYCYIVNPFIYFRGKDVAKSTVDLFKNSKWAKIDIE